MAQIPLAFYVLLTFFGIYFVAALLCSRPIRKSERSERPASDRQRFPEALGHKGGRTSR